MTAAGTDRIGLEVLRTRLEAIAHESAITIERTAISPVAVEAKDYSCTLLDDQGNLLMGGGFLDFHFHAASHAVRSTLATHAGTLAPGDVFLSNDPHSGGGCHAQDVLVQRPIFVDDRLVAWVVNSAHMMDMGGMAFGSWAPDATDCFQEALRFPPVHLFRAGEEERDVWAILRNNVRVSELIEMDMRALVAGCHVAQQKFLDLVAGGGADRFLQDVSTLAELSREELEHRVHALADGRYSKRSWVDWAGELYALPCTLTVDGERLVFDFEGAAPQCEHYFNSKPYIVASFVGTSVHALLGHDLPLSRAVFDTVEVRCPGGSITNSEPPAPVGSAHMEVGGTTGALASYCLQLALAASPGHPGQRFVGASTTQSFIGLQAWSAQGIDGAPDGWMMLDGIPGSPAAGGRDGTDLCNYLVGTGGAIEQVDVEVLESWYPMLVEERRIRPGAHGGGRWRGGSGCQMTYRPYGTPGFSGVMIGLGDTVPGGGWAGARPGSVTEFSVRRADGSMEGVSSRAQGFWLGEDEVFVLRAGSAGGFGDPLDRETGLVRRDVVDGRLSAAEAATAYGVVIDAGEQVDEEATVELRAGLRGDRLLRARPPTRPVTDVSQPFDDGSPPLSLYPGIEQRGSLAVSVVSGTPLARAPEDWTDGCAVLEERLVSPHGTELTLWTYLDPVTGHALFVDVVPSGEPLSLRSIPSRWALVTGGHS